MKLFDMELASSSVVMALFGILLSSLLTRFHLFAFGTRYQVSRPWKSMTKYKVRVGSTEFLANTVHTVYARPETAPAPQNPNQA
jgi:hypothetical protein